MGEKAGKIWLQPNERLAGISKEFHVRKQGGKYLAYIVEDKSRANVMLAQKLSAVAEAINALVNDDPEKVTVAGLYQPVNQNHKKCGERTGGWVKYRWGVRAYRLEDVIGVFESMRHNFDNALIIGSKDCYQTVIA